MQTTDEVNILNSDIVNYLERVAGPSPSPADAMEHRAGQDDFPIVGPMVGRLLKLMTSLMSPTRILELGSGFGYSAFWFGQGSARAEIHLTDHSQERLDDARDYLGQTDHPDRFHYHQGDALDVVETIHGPVDCVFIDIDKTQYPKALQWAEKRLPPGGLLVADNVLWKGKVARSGESDPATKAVRQFNQQLTEHPWDSSVLPLRDGVALARKSGRSDRDPTS